MTNTNVNVDKVVNDKGEDRFAYTLVREGQVIGAKGDFESYDEAEQAGLDAANADGGDKPEKAPAKAAAKKTAK